MAQTPKPYFYPSFTRGTVQISKFGGETGDSLSLLAWTPVVWGTGFYDYDQTGNQWGPVVYTKDRSGFVHFRGLCRYSGTSLPAYGTEIFNMPLGFRPDMFQLGLAVANWGMWEWQMLPSGSFQFRYAKLGTYNTANYFGFFQVSWWAPPQ